jgi:Polysaccharide deacetylase
MTSVFAEHESALRAGRFLRVVNFHATPTSRAEGYERQLARYADRYTSVTVADLDRLFETGRWEHDRPGLVPVFYEGWRNHYEVAAPLLDELGLVGWFFVPTALVELPPAEQKAFAAAHHLRYTDEGAEDGRVAMTWDELASVAERHVVAAHTASHAPISEVRTEEDVEREILEPRRAIERATGRAPEIFAWLYGQHWGANAFADEALRSAGYRYLVSNTKIQRLARPAA